MSRLAALEGGLLLMIQEHLRTDWMNGFWTAVTRLGDAGVFWVFLSLILIFFPRTRRAGIAALASMALCLLCGNLALKNLVARARPYELLPALRPLVERPKDYSFPSGHTSASFAAALSYLRMAPGKPAALAVALAALIAFSRMYVGVHYPTDVLGGFLLAFAASWVVCAWLKKREARKSVPAEDTTQ